MGKRIYAWVPKVATVLLGILWLGSVHHGYRYYQQAENAHPESFLQYLDREIRLMEATKRSEVNEALLMQEDEEREFYENVKRWLEEGKLEGHSEKSNVETWVDFKSEGEMMAEKVSYLSDYWGEVDKVWLRAWHYEMYLLHHPDDAAVREKYEAANDRLFRPVLQIGILTYVIWGAGILVVLLFFFRRPASQMTGHVTSRFHRTWGVWEIFLAFFLASMGVQYWLSVSYSLYDPYKLSGWEVGGWVRVVALIADEMTWRGMRAVLMAVMLIGSIKYWPRVLGLRMNQSVNWPLVLWAFGVTYTFDYAFSLLGLEGVIDPTDFIDSVSFEAVTFISALVGSVILAPLFEEVVFRGFLFRGLFKHFGFWGASLVSSVLFASIHIQYDLAEWAPLIVFGMACCYLVHKTGSVKSSIAFHALFNLLVTTWSILCYQVPLG